MKYLNSIWATILARFHGAAGGSRERIVKGTRTGSLLAAAALSLAFVMAPMPSAQAATLTVTGTGAGGNIETNLGTRFAVEIKTNLTFTDEDPLNFIAFCLEPTVSISLGSTYSADVRIDGTLAGTEVSGAGRIAWLMQKYAATPTNDQAKALQAAIWNIAAGTVLLDSDPVFGLYEQYLSISVNESAGLASLYWIRPTSNGTVAQGLIGFNPTYVPPSAVPEPSALLLLGLGLLGLGLARRKAA